MYSLVGFSLDVKLFSAVTMIDTYIRGLFISSWLPSLFVDTAEREKKVPFFPLRKTVMYFFIH